MEEVNIENMLKEIGVAPSLMSLITDLVELAKGDELIKDIKWKDRIRKAIAPLDIEDRVKSQLHTAARKELDTAAMKKHRRTGILDPVTNEDIEKLFQEKWEQYLMKKAEKEAKQKALANAEQ